MGKNSILTIAIQLVKQGNGDQATIKALAQLRSGWSQAMGVMAAVAGVGVTLNKVYQETAGVFMDYAGQVLATSRATGLSAQESSRLLQVTDDLGISYESLAKAIKSSAETTDFSIEGLAAASGQYLSIADAQERAKFAQEAYGKSWVDMVAVLEKGPTAIRAMSSAIDESLILTQQSITDYEEYRIQVDNLNDAVLGLKVSIGSQLVPALTESISAATKYRDAMDQASEETGRNDQRTRIMVASLIMQRNASLEAAQAVADHADRLGDMPPVLDETTAAMEENAAAVEATSKYYENLLSVTQQIDAANQTYTGVVREQFEVQAELNQQLAQGKITQEEYNTRIAEAGATVQQAAAEHEAASNRIIFSIIQMKMAADGLSAAEGEALLDIGVELGMFTKSSVDTAKEYMGKTDEMVAASSAAGSGIQTALEPATQALVDATEQAHGLKEQLDSIAKKSGSVWVFTIIINTIGSVPNLPGGGSNDSRGTAGGYESHNGVEERAEGGPLGAGWTWVGEAGRELISPSGYVFDHETSMKLAAAGIVPDRGLKIGGSLSEDESAYYASRPRGDAGEWRGGSSRRNRPSVRPRRGGRGGGADESGALPPVEPLVEETRAATSAMQSSSEAQTRATAAQTSAIVNGNSEVVTAINGMRNDIRKLTTTIPGAVKEAAQMAV